MKFLVLKSTNPYINLATEEYLFRKEKSDIFMLWQNEPTVVIGKNQNVYAEINKKFTDKNSIHIARRITGGGAVYHDLGNINYSFITNKKESNDIDFKFYTAPIIEALNSIGIKAELSGRNDLEIDGKKFSGNAQHREGNRVLHHGTILFDSKLEILNEALKADEEKIKAKAIKSTRARVVNLKSLINKNITLEEFLNILTDFIIKKYSPEIVEAPIQEEIEFLINKYKSSDWIFPKRDYVSNYTLTKKKKYDFGILNIEILMSNTTIKDIKIFGDFFGTEDISLLEDLIRGTSIDNIDDTLSNINIEKYIFGANSNHIIEQIKL